MCKRGHDNARVVLVRGYQTRVCRTCEADRMSAVRSDPRRRESENAAQRASLAAQRAAGVRPRKRPSGHHWTRTRGLVKAWPRGVSETAGVGIVP
mgnify:CR=1 FL=1